MPSGAFAPYTSISSNILFFDRTRPTTKIDYYQVPLPEGLKNGFTKTKPMKREHLDCVRNWWNNRGNGDINAYSVTIEDIKNAGYNLDFKNPNVMQDEKDYTLSELLESMNEKAIRIGEIIGELSNLLKGVEE
ncbi:N-6 DNA methylase [Caloramator sp. mosi_1]|nr:N-6 DNA methylase [Caloramator sp. mosi_1]WDC85636.1 N-6 DNA methylase [Caloramator sp. mosi_1]